MKNILKSVAIICPMLISSCVNINKTDAEKGIDVISINKSGRFTSDTLVESVTYLGLKPLDDCEISGIDKIVRVDSLYVIGDFRRGIICAYDSESGNPGFIINNIGQGPGEYSELSCFCCDKSRIYVVDNRRQQMLAYDALSGKFIESKKMPIIPDDVESLDNGGFLFVTVPLGSRRKLPNSNHRVHISDKDLNIVDNLFEYKDDEFDPIGQRYYLTKNNNKIVFGSLMFDGYTVMDDRDPSKYHQVKIDFKNGLQGKSDIDMRDVKNYDHLTLPPFISGNNAIISYTLGDGYIEYGLWNKDVNGILPMPSDNISKAIMPVVGVDGDKFIGYYDSYDRYKSAVDHGFAKASESVEDILKSEGSALVIYKMRQQVPSNTEN